jgi:hypothetical protein
MKPGCRVRLSGHQVFLEGVVADGTGNLYIADRSERLVRHFAVHV